MLHPGKTLFSLAAATFPGAETFPICVCAMETPHPFYEGLGNLGLLPHCSWGRDAVVNRIQLEH